MTKRYGRDSCSPYAQSKILCHSSPFWHHRNDSVLYGESTCDGKSAPTWSWGTPWSVCDRMPFEKRNKQSRQLRLPENSVLYSKTVEYDFVFLFFVREHQTGFVKSSWLFMQSKWWNGFGEDCSQSCWYVLVVGGSRNWGTLQLYVGSYHAVHRCINYVWRQ